MPNIEYVREVVQRSGSHKAKRILLDTFRVNKITELDEKDYQYFINLLEPPVKEMEQTIRIIEKKVQERRNAVTALRDEKEGIIESLIGCQRAIEEKMNEANELEHELRLLYTKNPGVEPMTQIANGINQAKTARPPYGKAERDYQDI